MKDNNEMKLTDEEIIKALECCANEMGCIKGCPCFSPKAKGSNCKISKIGIEKIALDLINRQKAEIEKYKQEQNEMAAMFDELGVILFGSRGEWEKILIAYIDNQRKEDEGK